MEGAGFYEGLDPISKLLNSMKLTTMVFLFFFISRFPPGKLSNSNRKAKPGKDNVFFIEN